MFIKITHTNSNNERVALVNKAEIVSLGELRRIPIRLYNEEGDLVEERQIETKKYVLVLKSGFKFIIEEKDYSDIEKQLLA